MKDARPAEQSESIAVRYMNRFAIEEDDQFEIAAIQTLDSEYDENDVIEKLDKAMQAVENLAKQQNQGMGYFHRTYANRIPVFSASKVTVLLKNT